MKVNAMTMFKNACEVYAYLCQPICKEYNLQQPALDMLVFLTKNPDMNTAVDIQKNEGIKQSLVSYHIDRLVNDGFVVRLTVPGDRRKIKLACTEKAVPAVEKCMEARAKLGGLMMKGLSDEEIKAYESISNIIADNISSCRELMKKGEL